MELHGVTSIASIRAEVFKDELPVGCCVGTLDREGGGGGQDAKVAARQAAKVHHLRPRIYGADAAAPHRWMIGG